MPHGKGAEKITLQQLLHSRCGATSDNSGPTLDIEQAYKVGDEFLTLDQMIERAGGKVQEDPTDEPACFMSHMGIYLVERKMGVAMAGMILAGQVRAESSEERERRRRMMGLKVEDGVAIIRLQGSMQRGYSKFGGTSTQHARKQIAEAVRSFKSDGEIKGIFLDVFSPGGAYYGTQQLADDIYEAAQVMPVHTHYQDLGASAAVFAGSQANTVSVNRGGEVGSIGTVMVVQDTSEKMKREGVKVHVISTGDQKGAGAPGSKITEGHLKKFRKEVNEANHMFLEALMRGRGLGIEAVTKLATGELFKAKDAQKVGLVDFVMSDTDALAKMKSGELGKKKIEKVVDSREESRDTDRTQDVVHKVPDTSREATMEEEQIIEFLQSSESGKKILAEQVENAVKAKIESGEILTKEDADKAVQAAVAVEKDAASEREETTKLAREIYEIDQTLPLEKVEAKLSECESKSHRAERAERMKAEAKLMAAKQKTATKDPSVVKATGDLEEQFEKKWADGDFGDPDDPKIKATKSSTKAYWLNRNKTISA